MCCEAKTQTNLVYNGDFEIYDTCPLNPSTPGDLQIEHCLGWTAPTKLGTSDYFNICNNIGTTLAGVPKNLLGYQHPLNGAGYCGLLACVVDSTNDTTISQNGIYIYREYIQTKLQQSLMSGKSYHFSFNVNASNDNTHSLIYLGALFSAQNYISNTFAPICTNPQIKNSSGYLIDTLNWIKIEGDFIANGSEEYLTIGYFENGNLDTLNNHYDPWNPYWRIVSYYYVDGISLIENACQQNFPNIFSPNADLVNDIAKFEACTTVLRTTVYNRWGNKIFETENSNHYWDGRTTSGEICPDGTYYYVLQTEEEIYKGFIQLVR